jgi:hypothetical protein
MNAAVLTKLVVVTLQKRTRAEELTARNAVYTNVRPYPGGGSEL